ncbi:hypothetical protein [Pseudomonas sp. FP818]|uniref:hypothetical protein n=1 Tax=Pseudomonas sp. FP818 TaxID=2954099 RepID=UPI002736A3F5|nr:hypothetical protein [Pseudomonas sp. FP818]WLI36344.1 hypothetical protein PSH80_08415 [Pseudomonas sp. FP818]
MASPDKTPSASWVDVPGIIDAVTNLYNAVAAKSPLVADTVVILAALLPFYIAYIWSIGLKGKEKKADTKVKVGRKATKKLGKGQSGGKKP